MGLLGLFGFGPKTKQDSAKKNAKKICVKQTIEAYRKQIAYQREQKKKDNEFYSRLIANTKDKKQKDWHRKNKAEHAAARDRTIAVYKRELEAAMFTLKNNCK